MQFIQLKNIHYCYPDQYETILCGIDLVIAEGEKIALIGGNGSGKTTLLRIILKELIPTQGMINYPGKPPAIAYLPQDINVSPGIQVQDFLLGVQAEKARLIKEIEKLSALMDLSPEQGIHLSSLWHEYHASNVADWESEVQSVLMQMNLTYLAERECNSLSGGESTRLQLAALLLGKPDILILDEPTNHLDLSNIIWLEDWLNSYSGAVLYVSHDKMFIDNTATKIAELKAGKLDIRMGNFASFSRDKADLQNHQLLQYQERKRLIRNLQQAVQKRRKWAQSFQRETRSEGRAAVYESVFNAARTQMQQARNIEKRIQMLNERYPVERPMFDKERKLDFGEVHLSNRELINVNSMSFAYGDEWIFKDFYFNLGSTERVWLSAANGCGKTTLMRLIYGEISPQKGEISYAPRLRIAYYRQDLSLLDPHQTVLDYLPDRGSEKTHIHNLMGCIGLKDDLAYVKIGSLSWGEKAKVQILGILLGDYNVLLLDEPTNHLDMRSRDLLARSLEKFTGAVVFVSHDRSFIQRIATRELKLGRYR
ncbi:MAG: ABC-F family ATP-binding cassette domain-containing protein [Candidatus Cloacimonetes bacterium]|nr:ABC-F family ATP-binding cassette domain-containing protein [Candidatus Cloacimonadota bacterium]